MVASHAAHMVWPSVSGAAWRPTWFDRGVSWLRSVGRWEDVDAGQAAPTSLARLDALFGDLRTGTPRSARLGNQASLAVPSRRYTDPNVVKSWLPAGQVLPPPLERSMGRTRGRRHPGRRPSAHSSC